MLLFGALVIVIGFAWPSVALISAGQNVQVPTAWLEGWIRSGDVVITAVIPHFSSSQTVNQFLEQQLVAQGVKSSEIPPGALDIARRQFGDQIGVQLFGGESMASVGAQAVNHVLNMWAHSNQPVFLGVVLLTVLMVWRIASPLVVLPTLAVLATLFFISLRIGLLFKVNNPVNVERLRL